MTKTLVETSWAQQIKNVVVRKLPYRYAKISGNLKYLLLRKRILGLKITNVHPFLL